MALNHYKCQMMFKYFYHLRRAPHKTKACLKLVRFFYRSGFQQPFNKIRVFGNDREMLVQDWRSSHDTYVVQRLIAVWHQIAVQQKIAKMFFKRKYLSALQDYVFEKNYIRPTALREHILKRKTLKAFASLKQNRW